MPRPGPRPYECVKRAWHSDRHQPIRGSIIQQIFRYAYETHSSKTKKNREWQEKLPIVVFKAEEIMYSKANSEAEYMNLDTLWDRINDAINTIIRREESAETGELLPPCVEAALTLGCIPIRASRSQRQSNPRSYLSPRTQEPGCVPPKVSDNSSLLCVDSAHQSISVRPENVNSAHLASEPSRPGMPHMTTSATPLCKSFASPASNNGESNIALNMGSVYPLYYGTDYHPEVCRLAFREPQTSNTIILGRPVFPSVAERSKVHRLPGLHQRNVDKNVACRTPHPESGDNYKNGPYMECDLSLRLGLSSDSGSYAGKDPATGTENVGPIDFPGAVDSTSSPRNKEFSFFPVDSANDPSGQHTSRMISEGEGQLAEASVRKRKMPFFDSKDNEQFFRQDRFAGQRKRPVFRKSSLLAKPCNTVFFHERKR